MVHSGYVYVRSWIHYRKSLTGLASASTTVKIVVPTYPSLNRSLPSKHKLLPHNHWLPNPFLLLASLPSSMLHRRSLPWICQEVLQLARAWIGQFTWEISTLRRRLRIYVMLFGEVCYKASDICQISILLYAESCLTTHLIGSDISCSSSLWHSSIPLLRSRSIKLRHTKDSAWTIDALKLVGVKMRVLWTLNLPWLCTRGQQGTFILETLRISRHSLKRGWRGTSVSMVILSSLTSWRRSESTGSLFHHELTFSDRNCAFVNFTNIANAIKAIDGTKNKPEYANLRIAHGKDRCANPPRSGPQGMGRRIASGSGGSTSAELINVVGESEDGEVPTPILNGDHDVIIDGQEMRIDGDQEVSITA